MSTDLYFEVRGQSSGPALMLMHPLGGNVRFWDECLPHWIQRYRTVAYDRRGSGRSPNPTKPATIQDHAEDAEELRIKLGLESIIPIGVAVGAMVAAAYTTFNPDKVPALILCDPALTIPDSTRKIVEKRVALICQGGIEAILPDAVDRAFYGLPRDQRYLRYLELFRQNDLEGYEYSALGCLGTDLALLLPQIQCPVLVAVGEFDILFPPEEATRVSEYIPQAIFHVMPNAAHFPPFQAPEAFVALVEDFLSSALAQSSR